MSHTFLYKVGHFIFPIELFMAKLYFRYGAMSSGKSAHLLQSAYNYEISGRKVIIAKPSIDIKSGSHVSSRIGISREIDFSIKKDTNIFEIFNQLNQIHLEKQGESLAALLIDESQFLTTEQVNQLLKIATFLDIPVMCFGIRTDFLTHGFEGSDRLLQIAHTIEEMKTICGQCGEAKATLNIRKDNGNAIFEGDKVSIDISSDTVKKQKHNITYESLCPACYLKASKGFLG